MTEAKAKGRADLVVLISSDVLGRGDDALGAILMGSFLDTLSAGTDQLSHLIFVNGGAKLVVEGSEALPQLQQLEELGARVLTCGTCLKYFGIGDELAVGKVSNMLEIIETLAGAEKIIRP